MPPSTVQRPSAGLLSEKSSKVRYWPLSVIRNELTDPKLLHFRSINKGVVRTENNYLPQTQLAERWQVVESMHERWRSEGIGPIYMKMMGRVRYRLSDITDF